MAKRITNRGVTKEADPSRFLDEYLPYWLSQASYWISSEFQREVSRAGFTFAEWRALACLYGSGGETIGALSRLALMKQPTLSKLVQRLETNGLVGRSATEGDRRQTLVVITPKGTARVANLVERARAHQDEVLRPFGVANARKLLMALQDLVHQHERGRLLGSQAPGDL
ncbi:MAG: winged helix-turn-helix transcriptional regulator [Rhodocyclaceae bacterium]|jgi:DNA-binding MarR family transcriptional regulator|nr:winged helix-turn-helix transcriptional regulator [Rhodocyclaceae bacterium]MBK6554627.1 winged helix-turn-helix transcriptional regulator [Rhodocyclaceae bacterium]MBK6677438.1 winged helix-turn-helix transcriptional regulator [Rhodocyclaceae bacterium]MBK9310094.1 winged helix-turn-helix transcriptional regulator [Rhodocyclaceae bacterium]MBK9954832.1 winged helix-turn-helix transcriptional regulator [Rhodocyclaceae bacterium]